MGRCDFLYMGGWNPLVIVRHQIKTHPYLPKCHNRAHCAVPLLKALQTIAAYLRVHLGRLDTREALWNRMVVGGLKLSKPNVTQLN